jgi:hypothetical protein
VCVRGSTWEARSLAGRDRNGQANDARARGMAQGQVLVGTCLSQKYTVLLGNRPLATVSSVALKITAVTLHSSWLGTQCPAVAITLGAISVPEQNPATFCEANCTSGQPEG